MVSTPEPEASVSQDAAAKHEINPLVKLLLEMGPLLVLFFANSRGAWLQETFPVLQVFGEPFFAATAIFLVALTISLTISWSMTRTLPVMPLVTFVFAVVFGGLTLWLQDETFFKMKPTLVNALFGTAILTGLLFGRNFLKLILDTAFQLDDAGWAKLALRWGIFFFFLAALNEIIWRNFSTDFWLNFKVWGTIPITIAFTATQMPLIMRHTIEKPDEEQTADG